MKIQNSDTWVDQHFGVCNLGDKRRTKRLVKVARQMLASPEESLPSQNLRWADLKAAYRLFECEDVTFEAVAEQHWQQTRQTKPGRYLLIGDTTDIDYFFHNATTGLGMLGDGHGRGVQLHNCLMYDCNHQLIAGSAGGVLHYRKPKPKNETKMQSLKRIRESDIWATVVDQVGAAPAESQWIHVFDRGGDNFEAMCHIHLTGNDWVIRAAKLQRRVITSDGRTISLGETLNEAKVIGSYELFLRSRQGVAARTANIEVSNLTVTLPQPVHCTNWLKECGIEELVMNVVVVQEVGAPAGVQPIRWVLLTSLPAKTFEEAWQIVEDYENRWLVEEYHKVLKTGCSIERHSLRTAKRLEPLIGMISVIGVRLFQLKLIGRSQPDAKASTHVPSNWLKCLKLVRPNVKLSGMTVYTFFREVAKLGGFLGRKCDGEPGWQTIWRGYQKVHTLLDALRLAGAI